MVQVLLSLLIFLFSTHPLQSVTAIDWLSRPHLREQSICLQMHGRGCGVGSFPPACVAWRLSNAVLSLERACSINLAGCGDFSNVVSRSGHGNEKAMTVLQFSTRAILAETDRAFCSLVCSLPAARRASGQRMAGGLLL